MSYDLHMFMHGLIVVGMGILYGFPYRYMLNNDRENPTTDVWRAAHSSACMGGILVIALGAAFPALEIEPDGLRIAGWLAIAAAYGFAVAIGAAALSGHRHRGHAWGGGFGNRVSWASYIFAIVATLLATALTVPTLFRLVFAG